MNQKSLDKKKTSELFEGVNSTLHQAFVGAVERDKNKPKELDWKKELDKLSLCHSCYCITKTIKGVCGKCGNIKPLTELLKNKGKELDWEKEFDKNWINPWNRNNFGIPKAHLDIKDFISRTLTKQRTELLEEIKMFPLLIRKEPEDKGYNLAVKEINNNITNLLNKKDESIE